MTTEREHLFYYGVRTGTKHRAESFEDIPEPWRTYAMLLDAATSMEPTEYDYIVAVIEGVGEKFMYELSRTTVYVFEQKIWFDHGGLVWN